MIAALEQMLPRIESWSIDDQLALLEVARNIEAGRTGAYQASADEISAIDRGIDDANASRFATERELAAVRARFRGA